MHCTGWLGPVSARSELGLPPALPDDVMPGTGDDLCGGSAAARSFRMCIGRRWALSTAGCMQAGQACPPRSSAVHPWAAHPCHRPSCATCSRQVGPQQWISSHTCDQMRQDCVAHPVRPAASAVPCAVRCCGCTACNPSIPCRPDAMPGATCKQPSRARSPMCTCHACAGWLHTSLPTCAGPPRPPFPGQLPPQIPQHLQQNPAPLMGSLGNYNAAAAANTDIWLSRQPAPPVRALSDSQDARELERSWSPASTLRTHVPWAAGPDSRPS